MSNPKQPAAADPKPEPPRTVDIRIGGLRVHSPDVKTGTAVIWPVKKSQ